jgi:hypothetical protein
MSETISKKTATRIAYVVLIFSFYGLASFGADLYGWIFG